MTPESLVLERTGLHIRWPDAEARLDGSLLRRSCRCRDCRRPVPTVRPMEPDIHLSDLSPVGAYGVQLHFDDGHDLGIYPWTYLRELAGLPPG